MAIQTISKVYSPIGMNSWQFPSSPGSIAEIEQLVAYLASKFKISEDKYPNILISLTEAVNNAIIHGNHCDECKCVHVHLEENPHGLTLVVRDEGCGFDPEAVKDPTLPENIANSGGRGIFLIKQLCDRVYYEANGTEVKMSFDF